MRYLPEPTVMSLQDLTSAPNILRICNQETSKTGIDSILMCGLRKYVKVDDLRDRWAWLYFPRAGLDGGGLASPEALAFHPMSVPDERSSGSIGAIPVGFIQAEQPVIIVSYDVFIEAFLRSPALQQYQRFLLPILNQEDYRASGIRDIWGSQALSVFIRNDFLAGKPNGCPALVITP